MAKDEKKHSKKKETAGRYFIFGVLKTLIELGFYEAFAILFFSGDQLWIASLISGVIGLFVGYFLHSHYTWKDREAGKEQLARFFMWNIPVEIGLRPLLTVVFGLFGPLYRFAYEIIHGIGIGMTEETVRTLGIFALVTAVTMILNFLVYDRFVFKKEKKTSEKPASQKSEED